MGRTNCSILEVQRKPDLFVDLSLLDWAFDLVGSKSFAWLLGLHRFDSFRNDRDFGRGASDLDRLRGLHWTSGLGWLRHLHGLKGLGWRRFDFLRGFRRLRCLDWACDLSLPRRRGWLR